MIATSSIALALGVPCAVAADNDAAGTRSNLIEERDHTIGLTMDHDHARMVVRRTLYNAAEGDDQARLRIETPKGAVATGLRTWFDEGRPRWSRGDLLEAETAVRRYEVRLGARSQTTQASTLLSWSSRFDLALRTCPVEARGTRTVEYTLHLPVEYSEGRYHVSLPPIGTERRPATLRVQKAHRADRLFIDDVPVSPGERVTLDRELTVSLARADAPRLDGRLASLPFGDDRVLVRIDLHAAARLSEIPANARIVVLLDVSRSLHDYEVETTAAAAAAYLHHFAAPALRARAELVTFAREPTRRFGALIEPARVIDELGRLQIPRRNGSNVDAALEQAAQILAKAGGGDRRIVLFTDTLTRSSLTPARLSAVARQSGAILHVVVASTLVDPSVRRDDEHAWADVARATGGLVWTATATEDELVRDRMQAAFEVLARPVRINRLTVEAPGLRDDAGRFPRELPEGSGLERLLVADRPVRHLKLEGELWSRPFREIVTPSRDHAELWAGLVFGTHLLDRLSKGEMTRLAMHGRVVSPVTSLLAAEPGVRPTEAVDPGEFGTFGTCCGEFLPKYGGGGYGRRYVSPVDPQSWLEQQLRDALTQCSAPAADATVELETTRAEIADVTWVRIHDADPTAHDCVREGFWGLELPHAFDRPFATWTVTI
jgi:hypothetical protein